MTWGLRATLLKFTSPFGDLAGTWPPCSGFLIASGASKGAHACPKPSWDIVGPPPRSSAWLPAAHVTAPRLLEKAAHCPLGPSPDSSLQVPSALQPMSFRVFQGGGGAP